jgi:hypothetical protein
MTRLPTPLRGLIEAAVILASILLAFAIDAWWDGRQARHLQEAVISAVALEAAANSADLNLAVDGTMDRLARIDRFLGLTGDSGRGVPADSVISIMLALPQAEIFDPVVSAASILAETPLLDEQGIAVRAAVDRWLTALTKTLEERERLYDSRAEVLGLLAKYAIRDSRDGMTSSIPAEVARTHPGILEELRTDDDLVAAVIEKAHWQRRYLDELERASAALRLMMDALAGSAVRR